MKMVLNHTTEVEIALFVREFQLTQNTVVVRVEMQNSENVENSLMELMNYAYTKTIIDNIVVYHNEETAYDISGRYAIRDISDTISDSGRVITVNFAPMEHKEEE